MVVNLKNKLKLRFYNLTVYKDNKNFCNTVRRLAAAAPPHTEQRN